MKIRERSLASVIGIVLAVLGLGLGLTAMIVSNPFLGLFAITVVCAGGVSALVGLQDT